MLNNDLLNTSVVKSTQSNMSDLSKVICYRCGKTGHVSSQCRKGLLRQLRLHLESTNPHSKGLIGSLCKTMQEAKQIPLHILKTLELDFKGVYYLKKINTNKHFSRSSTVEAYLNEVFTNLSLDELRRISQEKTEQELQPIIKKKKEQVTKVKEVRGQINDYKKQLMEEPEKHLSELKFIMPYYKINGFEDWKIINLKEGDPVNKNRFADALKDPAFQRDIEYFFTFHKKKIPQLMKLIEENKRISNELNEIKEAESAIIEEGERTRDMIQASYPEVKRQMKEDEKEIKQYQKELEAEEQKSYLRKRDERNYEIQRKRLNWEKKKYKNYMRDRNCQQYKDNYDIKKAEKEYDEMKDTMAVYQGDALDKKKDYIKYKKRCYNKKYGNYNNSYYNNYYYHPDTAS